MERKSNKEKISLKTSSANCLEIEGITDHLNKNSHLPVVPPASSKSATESTQEPPEDVSSRSSSVIPTPPLEPIKTNIRPIKQILREPTPNLLYMTAIQGNMAPRDDDDFSIISEKLEDYRIPDDVLLADEYTPAREDGRKPGIIDFVQNIVENRVSERRSYGSVALTTTQFFLTILDHLLKLLIIYLFIMAIYFCHGGKCTNRVDNYYGNADRVKRIRI